VQLRCEGTKRFKRVRSANMTAADPFADVNATSKRMDAIPGVGPALATALVASIADPGAFRDFSAWVELVPKQNSSGVRTSLAASANKADRYLRSQFTAGALAVIRCAKIHGTQHRPGSPHCWLGDPPRSPLSRSPTATTTIRR
jgi:Transposase IS116/IS110/IS902 family